jgi:hypothetical protein
MMGLLYNSGKAFAAYSNGRLKAIFGNDMMSVNTLRLSFATILKQIPDMSVGENEKCMLGTWGIHWKSR